MRGRSPFDWPMRDETIGKPGALCDVSAQPFGVLEDLAARRTIFELSVAIDDVAADHDNLGVRTLAGADKCGQWALQDAHMRSAHVEDCDIRLFSDIERADLVVKTDRTRTVDSCHLDGAFD